MAMCDIVYVLYSKSNFYTTWADTWAMDVVGIVVDACLFQQLSLYLKFEAC